MRKKNNLRLKQVLVLLKYAFFSVITKKDVRNVWLISERGDEARDNGYAFYKFMLEKHPEVDFRYVIDRKSPDLARFEDTSRIVYLRSKEHFRLFLKAEYLISTHIMGYSPEFRIFNKLDKWGLVRVPGKRIYLTHGIDKDNTDGLKKGNIKVDMFVCGAKPQYDYEKKVLGHPNGVLQYTGMPRYDYLKNNLKNQIVIMPTWRMWLFYCNSVNEFKQTDYYKNWDRLLSNRGFVKWLEKNNLEAVFYPHYEVQPYLDAFSGYDGRIKIADFKNYDVQTLLNESKMMITDYSSVAFDFAYLKKPMIYYQFDYGDYMNRHFGKGYFTYSEDGFGAVVDDVESVLRELELCSESGFRVVKKYAENRKEFFTLPVGGNCERVYDTILRSKNHYWKGTKDVK